MKLKWDEKYMDTHRPRDPRKLDLDWCWGAHVGPHRPNDMACEKCVWGSGEHRADCSHSPTLGTGIVSQALLEWEMRYGKLEAKC